MISIKAIKVMENLKIKSINEIRSLDIINPNWGNLQTIEEKLKTRVITEKSNLSIKLEVDDGGVTKDKVLPFDPVKNKKKEIYIKHDSVLIYSGMNRAAFSYEIMLDFALNELMRKQGIMRFNIKESSFNWNGRKEYYAGYVYLNNNAIKFIVDFFNKRTKIKSFISKDEKQKSAKIRSEIKRLIECGFINKVHCIKDDKIYEVDKLYSLNIFDCYPGFQIDKISYIIIKSEKIIFDRKHPDINYNDYINKNIANEELINNNVYEKVEKININDLEGINQNLITIIKVYKKELAFALKNNITEGIKFNVSLLAKEHGCTRKLFSGKIKDLVKNEDLIETKNNYYILNPERYCV